MDENLESSSHQGVQAPLGLADQRELASLPSGSDASDASLGERITVCLLTYNHAHMLASTLAAILNQTVSGYEVLVSDDCSTDGTWELLKQLALQDPRVRVLRTPQNLGMAGNANYAVAHTQRPYIALLHHDDLCREDLLERWGRVLDRHADVGFVFNRYLNEATGEVSDEEMPGERVDGGWLLRRHLLAHWGCVVRGTAMIRREAFERIGGMRLSFGLLADIDLWMRLARSGPVGYVTLPLITVRHERPTNYPEEYQGDGWSWRRQRLLYEIHAANLLGASEAGSVAGLMTRLWFRCRVSLETGKWLAYAVFRTKRAMITSALEGATPYDLPPLRLLRWLLMKFC
jgi:GT2 family glycosyltransferase